MIRATWLGQLFFKSGMGLLLACWPALLFADPFDKGEAYTTRQGPPEWMDSVDFGLLLVDYGVFALMVIALGWLFVKKPTYLNRLESLIRSPFRAIFHTAQCAGGVNKLILQVFGGLLMFLSLSAWVFFCQWLKHEGLGALSMIGLAFAAFMLVRLLKGDEKPKPV